MPYQMLSYLVLLVPGSLCLLLHFFLVLLDLDCINLLSEISLSAFLSAMFGVTDTKESGDTVTLKWISTSQCISFGLLSEKITEFELRTCSHKHMHICKCIMCVRKQISRHKGVLGHRSNCLFWFSIWVFVYNHVKLGIFSVYGLGRSLGDCRTALPEGKKYQMVKTQTEPW